MANYHEIDPDGDVYLILERQHEVDVYDEKTTPSNDDVEIDGWGFSKCTKTIKKGKKKKKKSLTPFLEPEWEEVSGGQSSVPKAELQFDHAPDRNCDPASQDPGFGFGMPFAQETHPGDAFDDENTVRIRVSSKHLTLASSYFKRCLGPDMTEGQTLKTVGHVELPLKELDPEAMLAVMTIIHGFFRRVPKSVDLDLVVRIAIIVDYLDCAEIVEPFKTSWIDGLKAGIPVTFSAELVRWLFVCCVFRDKERFSTVSSRIIRLCPGPMPLYSLPIRESISDEIDRRRNAVFDQILDALDNLLENLLNSNTNCRFECNAMLYGALVIGLTKENLMLPRLETPFRNSSVDKFILSLQGIRDPHWCGDVGPFGQFNEHRCKLSPQIKSIIDKFAGKTEGLSLPELI